MSLPRSFTAEQLEMARQLRAEQAAAGSFHSGRQGNVPRRGQRSGHRGPTTRSWGTHSFQQGRAAFATPRSSRSSFNASNGRSPFASGHPVNSQPTEELVRFGGNVSTPTTGQFVNSSSAGASSSSPPIEPETVSTQENDRPDYPLPLLDTDIDPGFTAPTLIPTAVNTPGNTPGNT
ncbi:hypothetical protein B7494_g773 [Chlorociboria aeruginascens]|nr:hypothetical protein B7494_g773 [Chlorociboria aeruginascens]